MLWYLTNTLISRRWFDSLISDYQIVSRSYIPYYFKVSILIDLYFATQLSINWIYFQAPLSIDGESVLVIRNTFKLATFRIYKCFSMVRLFLIFGTRIIRLGLLLIVASFWYKSYLLQFYQRLILFYNDLKHSCDVISCLVCTMYIR